MNYPLATTVGDTKILKMPNGKFRLVLERPGKRGRTYLSRAFNELDHAVLLAERNQLIDRFEIRLDEEEETVEA